MEQAGIVITSGNSPELVRAFYDTYLQWIDWRARQRKVPASLARWQARRVEPFPKFATVASTLGADCRIWVSWWEGRPVGATISLYTSNTAIGWRCFTDRSVPSRFRLSEVLMVEGLRHACESGCRYIEMGESVGKEDLASIKARLGGQQQPCAEYCSSACRSHRAAWPSRGSAATRRNRSSRTARGLIRGGPSQARGGRVRSADGRPAVTSPVPRTVRESSSARARTRWPALRFRGPWGAYPYGLRPHPRRATCKCSAWRGQETPLRSLAQAFHRGSIVDRAPP